MSEAVQAPYRVHDPTLFRPAPLSTSSGGQLLAGGKFAWLVSPSGLLSVFESSNGDCVTQLRLSPPLGKTGRRLTVSCSCELRVPARGEQLLALAVTQDGVRAKTIVLVVEPLSSRLLRALEIPWSVSSLCGVSGEAVRTATAGLFSSSPLREFSGVLAVGCAEGHVILVDLAVGVALVEGRGSLQDPLQPEFVGVVRGGGDTKVGIARGNGETFTCIDLLGMYTIMWRLRTMWF